MINHGNVNYDDNIYDYIIYAQTNCDHSNMMILASIISYMPKPVVIIQI